jgi:hypothetical protein
MLKISFLEFVLRGIPEGLLFFLAMYAFSKNIVTGKRYFFSSLIYSIIVYIIRFLPIQNGADLILNLIALIGISIFINKIEIVNAIKSGIIIMIIEFICEGINIFILQFVLKMDLNQLFSNRILKIIYTLPSLLIFACVAIIYYIILWKRKELRYIINGEDL